VADAVTSTVLPATGGAQYALSRLCTSDGTGESAAIVADKSALAINDVAVGHMAIERVRGFNSGFTSITLSWDHTTDDRALVLPSGAFDLDFRDLGGLHDPQSAGGTGDLVITTAGPTNGDIYHLILELRLYA
jgi:hypothetical protein